MIYKWVRAAELAKDHASNNNSGNFIVFEHVQEVLFNLDSAIFSMSFDENRAAESDVTKRADYCIT